MNYGKLLWQRGDYYLYADACKADSYTLYICGDLPVMGTLDEIRDYLKDQLGEDYYEALTGFWEKQ